MKMEFSGKMRALCFLNIVPKFRNASVQKPIHGPNSDPKNHFPTEILIFGHSGLSGTTQAANGSLRPFPALLGKGVSTS